MNLDQSIDSGSGIYKRYASRLEKLGIRSFKDFLYHIPHRYDDFSQTKTIASISAGEIVTIKGSVMSIKNAYTKFHKTIQKAIITDGTGTLESVWFNQPYLIRQIRTNDEILLSGRAEYTGNKITMQSPEYELVTNQSFQLHTGRLVPIYPETKGISSKWLRRQVYALLQELHLLTRSMTEISSEKIGYPYEKLVNSKTSSLEDHLPEFVKTKFNLLNLDHAIRMVHFPTTYEEVFKAKERLAFDELFLLQLQTYHRRHLWLHSEKTSSLFLSKDSLKQILASLPFSLTNAQIHALDTILFDMQKVIPMNRMLQGDVGSGKTIVAAIAMYTAITNNKDAILMAPTEILAEQHYKSICNILQPFGVSIQLITGSKKMRVHQTDKSNKEISDNKNHSKSTIFIGTHALLYGKVNFENVSLVVIDEQQRFGVEQRGLIREKGNNPHTLTMTATPIPRTMALTVYGDLDVSYLNEMPIGRKIVKTWLVPPEKRMNAYEWVRRQIVDTDSQAFVICPFIETSESLQTVKAASVEYERLKEEVFPDLKLGLLHGKMKTKQKDDVLLQFRNKAFHILVATPVVEVGIDITNATIIIIEASERFGLSQLHQLRGRVGRGEKQSYCLLFTETKNPTTLKRLKSLETTYSGAKLAELDLQLRGAGDLYGTLQSGHHMLKIATLNDIELIEKARSAAIQVYQQLEAFPLLQSIVTLSEKKNITKD